MRRLYFVAALVLALASAPLPASFAGSLEESVPWHERAIQSREGKVKEYEAILHDYDAELRELDLKDPQTTKRRTEIRIIKRYYNEQIDDLKGQIIEHYKAIRELKAKGAS